MSPSQPATADPEDVRPSRLADGFDLIASDLLRALSLARFTPAERWLIDRAMEASWFKPRREAGGFVEAEPFHLGMSEMARLGGFNRTHLIKAHADLVAARVFLPLVTDPEWYTLNKDFREWQGKDGLPRLSESHVEWCFEVKNRLKTVGKNRHNGKVGVGSTRQNGKVGVGKNRQHLSARVRRSVGENRHFEASPLTTPIEERAPGELRELESKTPQPPAAGGLEGERSSEQSSEPDMPPGVDPRAPHLLSEADRAELDAVARLCEDYFPMRDDLRRVVSDRQGNYPVHAYRLAVEAFRDQPREKWGSKYLLGFIKNRADHPAPAAIPRAPAPNEIAGPDPAHIGKVRALEEIRAKSPKPKPKPKGADLR